MILVIDNFDSFTWNIVQYLLGLGAEVVVKRNDEITVKEIEALKPEKILLSPGPSNPDHAGVTLETIRVFAGKIPIFGVCLGHQSIGQAFGGKVIRARSLYHGKTSRIRHDGKGVFAGMAQDFVATRYHSLVIEKATCPEDLEITALSEDGEIMGVRHRKLMVEGVQFHPESIATEGGMRILENFLTAKSAEPRLPELLRKVSGGGSLSQSEAETAMEEIGSGSASPARIAGFLTALSMKGETAAEIAGMARVMRRLALGVRKPAGRKTVDTCGTGGDRSGTFNISTTAAFVVAGAGVPVAKHGNRSVTSRVGSADVLEHLGVPLGLSAEAASRCLEQVGIAFLFAPSHHPAMKHAAPVRKELGIRTVFNLLGPLSNPAGADAQVIGVWDASLTSVVAEALALLGVERAMVVHGGDGLDEITLAATTRVSEVKDGWVRTWEFDPRSVGMEPVNRELLHGGDLPTNSRILIEILEGRKNAARDVVLLNAAAALVTASAAKDMLEGVEKAKASIDGGAARAKLEALRGFKA